MAEAVDEAARRVIDAALPDIEPPAPAAPVVPATPSAVAAGPLTGAERELLYQQARHIKDPRTALYALLACLADIDSGSFFPSMPLCFHRVRGVDSHFLCNRLMQTEIAIIIFHLSEMR